MRWRINAAIIDSLIVLGGGLLACWALHWRVLAAHTLILIGVAHLLYHFVLEARTGQTIGKRHYGVRVVALDGGPASTGQVALRTLMRIVDQLPTWYVSGLVSMVLTGRARRQRLGDRVGQTLVLAVDGQAATLGTPGWLLPVLATLALLVSAASFYGVLHAGDAPINATQRAEFMAGCDRGVGAGAIDCRCVLDQLESAGYDTPNKINALYSEVRQAILSRNALILPPALVQAARTCRR